MMLLKTVALLAQLNSFYWAGFVLIVLHSREMYLIVVGSWWFSYHSNSLGFGYSRFRLLTKRAITCRILQFLIT